MKNLNESLLCDKNLKTVLLNEAGPETIPFENISGIISNQEIINRLQNDILRYKHLFQTVIHELKYPVRNILALSRLLEKDIPPEDHKELLDIFKDSCVDALDMLNNLLIHERDENLKFEPVSVNALLKNCRAGVLGVAAAKNIRTSFMLLRQDREININKPAVKKALDNIIANAIKFSPGGSRVKVSAKVRENKLIISIADEGIGIPKQQQPFIFKKFNRTARSGTSGEVSTGLGLYIAKQSILAHYGRIWFESTENKGTVFHIEFDLNILATSGDNCNESIINS